MRSRFSGREDSPAATVAARVDVSERSVRRISQEPLVSTRDDRTLAQAHWVGHLWTEAAVEPRLGEWLQEDEGRPRIKLPRRAGEAGYQGGKSVGAATPRDRGAGGPRQGRDRRVQPARLRAFFAMPRGEC